MRFLSSQQKILHLSGNLFTIGIPMLNNDASTEFSAATEALKSIMYDSNGILKSWSEIESVPNSSELITAFIDELVETQTNLQLEAWGEQGIYDAESGAMQFIDYGYSKFVNENITIPGDKSIRYTNKAKAKFIAMDYVINYMLHYLNTTQVFYGDPALYYKGFKYSEETGLRGTETVLQHIESSMINMGKRLASNNAPGYEGMQEITDRSPLANVVFVEDVEGASIAKAYIERVVEDHASYDKITATDAQELNTLQEFAFRMLSHGYISETDYKEIMDNYYNLPDRLIKKILGQPMKPVHRGTQIDPKLRYERVIYIKTSAYPLIPQFVKGTPLEKLRKQMEEKDGKLLGLSESINRVVFDSGVKVGGRVDAKGKYLKVWDNKTGNINDNLDFNPYLLQIDRKSDRIQQEVPYKADKREVNRSTQVDQNLFVDWLDISGFKLPSWAKAAPKSSTDVALPTDNYTDGRGIKELYDGLQERMYEEAWKELEANLFNKAGELDRSKLAEMIKEEAISRNYPPAILEYLSVNSRNRFKYSLALLPEADKVESLLLSIIDNKVRKKKMPGFSGVLASESGYNGISADIVYTGNDTYDAKVGLKPQRVTFVRNGETIDIGHKEYESLLDDYDNDRVTKNIEVVVRGSQILVPWKFRNATGKLLDVKEFLVEKDGVKYLDPSKMDKELLEMFAFRIPNQGAHSNALTEIVGFLPLYMGDLVIPSKDLTIQMGIDFGGCKVYFYHFASTIIDGAIRKISNEINYSKLKMQMNYSYLSYNEIKFSKQVNQNKLIDLYLCLYKNPEKEIQKRIITPINNRLIASHIKTLNNIDLFKVPLLSDQYQHLNFCQRNHKDYLIRIFSNGLRLNSIMQNKRLDLSEKLYNEIGSSLNFINDDLIKNYINGKFESGINNDRRAILLLILNFLYKKDNTINLLSLNINIVTGPILYFLIQQGLDFDTSIILINQPIIKTVSNRVCSKYFELNTDIIINHLNLEFQTIEKEISSFIDSQENYDSQTNLENRIIDIKELLDYTSNPHRDSNFYSNQIKILQFLLICHKNGVMFLSVFRSIKTYTTGMGINHFSLEYNVKNLESIIQKNELPFFSKTLEESPVGYDIKNSSLKYYNLIKHNTEEFFPVNSEPFKLIVNLLQKYTGKTDLFQKNISPQKIKSEIWIPFKAFLYSINIKELLKLRNRTTAYPQNPSIIDERRRLFINTNNPNTLAQRIHKHKKTSKGKSNGFLNQISVYRNYELPFFEYIHYPGEKGRLQDESKIYWGFRDLMENDDTFEIGIDLIIAAFIGGGIHGAHHYVHYIPFEILSTSNFLEATTQSYHNIFKDWEKKTMNENDNHRLINSFFYQWMQHHPNLLMKYWSEINIESLNLIWAQIKQTNQNIRHPQIYLSENFSVYDLLSEQMPPIVPVLDKLKTGNKNRILIANAEKPTFETADRLGNYLMYEFSPDNIIGHTILA